MLRTRSFRSAWHLKEEARPDASSARCHDQRSSPHEKRGVNAGPGSDGYLRIGTNLLDVPAWVIGLIFRYRWTIEVFFRFFKHVLGCRHLLSTQREGIEIQVYMAIICLAC